MKNPQWTSLERWWHGLLFRFPETERMRAGILLVTSIPVTLGIWAVALHEVYLGESLDALILALGGAVIWISLVVLLQTRQTRVAGYLFAFTVTAMFIIGIWTGDILGRGVIWIPMSALIGFFVLPRRPAITIYGVMAAVVSAGEAARFLGLSWAPDLSWEQAVELYLSLGFTTLLVLFISTVITDDRTEVTNQSRQLVRAVADLKTEVGKRKRAEQELRDRVRQLGDARAALLNVLEDTEHERQARAHEQERLQMILNELPVGVFIARAPEGTGIMLNKAGAAILGRELPMGISKDDYSKAYRLVRADGTLFPAEETPPFVTLRTGQPARSSDVFVAHGPKRLVNMFVSSTPLYDKDGRIDAVVSVFEDRTAEYLADRAKTEFVSIASHQLYTPLNAIRWIAEALRRGHAGALKPKQTEMLQEIEGANLRMINLVSSLLNASRLESGSFAVHPQLVDLNRVAQEAFDVLAHEIAEKRLKTDKRVDVSNPYRADSGLLNIVLQNLLSNSVRYTPEGGSVSLRIGMAKKGDTVAGRTLLAPQLFIEVTDTGCGIPEIDQPKIFSKMFRADNARTMFPNGTGLGLYTVKSAVAAVGGDIWFTSKEHEGSTFAVTLPPEGMSERAGSHSLELVL